MFCFAAPLLWTKNVPVLTFWCSVDAVFAMAHSLHNLVIDKCCLGRLFQVIILNLEKYPFAPLASEWKLTRKAQKMHKLGTLWKIQSGIIHFGKVHPPTKICLYFAEFNGGYILVNGALVVIWWMRAVQGEGDMLMHLTISEQHFHWRSPWIAKEQRCLFYVWLFFSCFKIFSMYKWHKMSLSCAGSFSEVCFAGLVQSQFLGATLNF